MKGRKKKPFPLFKSSNCQSARGCQVLYGGSSYPELPPGWSMETYGFVSFFSTGGGNRLKNKKIIINKLIIYFCLLVGCGASVRLRVGPLWRSGRIATTVDVEQPIAGRFRTVAVGRPQTGQLDDPRTVLHRPLPLLTGQYFRIPGT